MKLIKRITEFFDSSAEVDLAGYWVYVRCNTCQEVLKTRVNLHNDLSIRYDEPGGPSYFCRKMIVGRSGCFQRIEIELTFNQKRKLVEREIAGGIFIDKEEYLAAQEKE